MDFSHPEDRQMLADTLGRYLADKYTFEDRARIAGSTQGWCREQWSSLAQLGIMGALFSEEAGGYCGGAFDIAVVFEQVGKTLAVEPLLGTLMAGHALEHAGNEHALIAEAIAGNAVLAFAFQEAASRYAPHLCDCAAKQAGEGWTITGAKAVTPQIEAADHIVVLARTASSPDAQGAAHSLFLVAADQAGVAINGYPMIDGGRGGELALNNANARLVGNRGDGLALAERAIAIGTLALSWEAIGVMDTIKVQTLEFLRTRTQFSVPIGKFQALQHRMATLALEIEQARSAAINAAAALEAERHTRERAVSAAKFTIGQVGTLVAEEAIQLHGGIGMTWELPLSHYAKRLLMIGHQLGDEDYHLERFMAFSAAETSVETQAGAPA